MNTSLRKVLEQKGSHVYVTSPAQSILDAIKTMQDKKVGGLLVVEDGKPVGMFTERDVLTRVAAHEFDPANTNVSEVMTKKVITVAEDTPIEEAARIMADNKIGGLPVMRDSHVVGIITETDLFKVFLELMGARENGVRVTALIEEKPGQLAKITEAIANAGGNFVAFGQFAGEDPSTRLVTFKVAGLKKDEVKKAVSEIAKEIWDVREI